MLGLDVKKPLRGTRLHCQPTCQTLHLLHFKVKLSIGEIKAELENQVTDTLKDVFEKFANLTARVPSYLWFSRDGYLAMRLCGSRLTLRSNYRQCQTRFLNYPWCFHGRSCHHSDALQFTLRKCIFLSPSSDISIVSILLRSGSRVLATLFPLGLPPAVHQIC